MNAPALCCVSAHQTNNRKSFKRHSKVKGSMTPNIHSYGITSLNKPGDRLLATFVNQMVASAYEIPSQRLLKDDRGTAKATRARQISIYLMHTGLSFSLSKISRIYRKDRTTIGYACRVVEDLRDTPAFDDRLIELEETINTVLILAAYIPENGGQNAK